MAKKRTYRIEWEDAELSMDTKRDLEGLHFYMIQRGKKIWNDGVVEEVMNEISEHADRDRARRIRNEIDRRLFGGPTYDGMPGFLE